MADEGANDPSRTVDAAIQPNEVAICPKASEEMTEEAMHQDFTAQRDADATTADGNPAVMPAVETRPAVVEEKGVCDQEEGAQQDLKPDPTASDLVSIVDPPTSSDEATSEISNGDNADPQVDDGDETASDIALSTAVNTTISSSPLMGDRREDASCAPGDYVQFTQDRLEVVGNPGCSAETVAPVETGDLPPLPIVDNSAAVPPLSELLAGEDEGTNGEILKPQILASHATHDAAPAGIAGNAPSAASTPLQHTRGDEENAGENVAVSETPRPDEESHDGGDNKAFVNRGLAMWEQSRQQWLHRREAGESRNSDGSQLAAIPLDVVRTWYSTVVVLNGMSPSRRKLTFAQHNVRSRMRSSTLCSQVPSRYAKRVDRDHSPNLSLSRK
jgi:Protein of unknown function (DUF4050)